MSNGNEVYLDALNSILDQSKTTGMELSQFRNTCRTVADGIMNALIKVGAYEMPISDYKWTKVGKTGEANVPPGTKSPREDYLVKKNTLDNFSPNGGNDMVGFGMPKPSLQELNTFVADLEKGLLKEVFAFIERQTAGVADAKSSLKTTLEAAQNLLK